MGTALAAIETNSGEGDTNPMEDEKDPLVGI